MEASEDQRIQSNSYMIDAHKLEMLQDTALSSEPDRAVEVQISTSKDFQKDMYIGSGGPFNSVDYPPNEAQSPIKFLDSDQASQ